MDLFLYVNGLRHERVKNSFFSYCINECNNLTVEIRNSKSVSTLKKLIKCEKKENSIFSIYDQSIYDQYMIRVKLLTRLRLKFCHLNEHKFRHGFGDTMNAMCACGSEGETTKHFLLHCDLYFPQRPELSENQTNNNYLLSFLNSFFVFNLICAYK